LRQWGLDEAWSRAFQRSRCDRFPSNKYRPEKAGPALHLGFTRPGDRALAKSMSDFGCLLRLYPVNMLAVTMHKAVSSRSSDEALLQAFAGSNSEKAFGALVEKYLGMVLGIATRRTGNRALAEEIAQDVFTVLARKAKGLRPGSTLAGWIHRVTVLECAEAMRRELSHQTKMNAVSRHLASELDGRDIWHDALPLLDEAINTLNRAEREVILLRFFERKSFRDIGTALGKSDDAAQKQTERALQKLSDLLKRKGVSVPVVVLGTGLSSHLAQAAPSALTHVIAHGALSTATTFNAKILILKTLQAMTSTKLKTAIVATAALSVPIVMQWAENSRLRADLNLAQQQRGAFSVSANARNGDRSSTKLAALPQRAGITASDPSPSASSSGLRPEDSTNFDPIAAAHDWEHVLFIADPLQRAQRLSQLLAALTAENAPQIAEAFERVKNAGIKFADEQRLFLRAWGKLDGSAAVEYAVGHSGQSSDEAVAALGGWASAAPAAAQAWLDAQPESDAKETLTYGLLDGWSTVDFQAAAAYAESRPSSPARDSFRELLLQRALRSGGITAAQNWVDRIPENDQNRDYKQRAFGDVIQAMLYRDPAAAARWISELNGQAFVGTDAVTNTAAKLAETSPTDALRWLTTLKLTDANGAGQGAGAVLQTWAQQNPEAAGAWLQQNPNHPFYDQMTASYVRTVAGVDRNVAQEWAQTIRNAQVREEALAALEPKQGMSYKLAMVADGLASGSAKDALVNWISAGSGISGDSGSGASTIQYIELHTPRELDVETGARAVRLTGQRNLGSGSLRPGISNPGTSNPHGSGPQWTNCASCHNQ
jgi:RNA polymerase sigma factor (sigma-70 family)